MGELRQAIANFRLGNWVKDYLIKGQRAEKDTANFV